MQKIQWTEGSQDFNPNVRLSFFFSLWKWAVIKTASAMLKLLKGEKWTGQKSASTAYFTWGWVEWLVFFVSHSPLHWVFCFISSAGKHIYLTSHFILKNKKTGITRGGAGFQNSEIVTFLLPKSNQPIPYGHIFSVKDAWRVILLFFFCAAVLRESWCVTPVQNQKYVWHKT